MSEMITAWMRSEEVCLEYIGKSISWLDDFHNSDSQLFTVAYSGGDTISSGESPNAASSIINIVLRNLNAPYVNLLDIQEWGILKSKAEQVCNSIATAALKDALPLESFGLLPLFSTCYLAESLVASEKILLNRTYATAVRRILYELYSQERQRVSSLARTDPLHPFLSYRCARVLLGLTAVLGAADVSQRNVFSNNLLDVNILKNAICERFNITSIDNVLDGKLAEIYGVGRDAREFGDLLSSIFSVGASRANTVAVDLQSLELKAYNDALSELAKLNKTNGNVVDPSSLVFSLSVLNELNFARHSNVIRQGLKVILHCCEQGLFRSVMPFHIDNKGRATFVPSVEIANAALMLFLTYINRSLAEDLEEIIAVTKSIENYYAESYNTVEVQAATGALKEIRGWCSDTAPSLSRVDSWVTVHVLAFFVMRLSILRHAKRHHILKRYSWIPAERSSPKWEDIVDPDEGLGINSTKSVIERIVLEEPKHRKKSPIFILYGPPGTSKTTLVNGLAKKVGWDLITLSPSDFIAESLDLIEQQSRHIFTDLMNMDECVILLDEMDSLLRDRELLAGKGQGSLIEFVVPAFLPKLQQLREYALRQRMAVFFITNYYETIDRAILRPGRIDTHILVLPYNKPGRLKLMAALLDRALDSNPDACKKSMDFITQKVETNDETARLITYREAEQLVELIAGEVKKGGVPSNGDLAGWSAALSIAPDIYARRETSAFRELCALIGRILDDQAHNATFSTMTVEEAISFLKDNHHHLNKSSWYGLVDRWIRKLEKQLLSH